VLDWRVCLGLRLVRYHFFISHFLFRVGIYRRVRDGLFVCISCFFDRYPSVVNNESSSEKVRKAGVRIFGEKGVVKPKLFMGGEDFAYFLQKVGKGAFFFLGAVSQEEEEKRVPHHNASFYIDESVLPLGTSVFVQLAQDLLSK